eukprot:TRINITY_DN16838_c0_g2_i1.p1 TRINITY_DN16838_c0_g2~~TRINITY_DN16838_c0_g2_i1.p1  ORF type:complete len:742 (+),score=168.06 TRINITY_DN16838_c0_g2_i1:162-2387(+)
MADLLSPRGSISSSGGNGRRLSVSTAGEDSEEHGGDEILTSKPSTGAQRRCVSFSAGKTGQNNKTLFRQKTINVGKQLEGSRHTKARKSLARGKTFMEGPASPKSPASPGSGGRGRLRRTGSTDLDAATEDDSEHQLQAARLRNVFSAVRAKLAKSKQEAEAAQQERKVTFKEVANMILQELRRLNTGMLFLSTIDPTQKSALVKLYRELIHECLADLHNKDDAMLNHIMNLFRPYEDEVKDWRTGEGGPLSRHLAAVHDASSACDIQNDWVQHAMEDLEQAVRRVRRAQGLGSTPSSSSDDDDDEESTDEELDCAADSRWQDFQHEPSPFERKLLRKLRRCCRFLKQLRARTAEVKRAFQKLVDCEADHRGGKLNEQMQQWFPDEVHRQAVRALLDGLPSFALKVALEELEAEIPTGNQHAALPFLMLMKAKKSFLGKKVPRPSVRMPRCGAPGALGGGDDEDDSRSIRSTMKRSALLDSRGAVNIEPPDGDRSSLGFRGSSGSKGRSSFPEQERTSSRTSRGLLTATVGGGGARGSRGACGSGASSPFLAVPDAFSPQRGTESSRDGWSNFGASESSHSDAGSRAPTPPIGLRLARGVFNVSNDRREGMALKGSTRAPTPPLVLSKAGAAGADPEESDVESALHSSLLTPRDSQLPLLGVVPAIGADAGQWAAQRGAARSKRLIVVSEDASFLSRQGALSQQRHKLSQSQSRQGSVCEVGRTGFCTSVFAVEESSRACL